MSAMHPDTMQTEQTEIFNYGRVTIENPFFVLKENGAHNDRTIFLRKQSILGTFKRQSILRNEGKGEGGKNLNIASFSFEFFDSDENSIFADPVFYGHNCENFVNVAEFKVPHFFLSGRHRRKDLESNTSSLGPSTTSLSVAYVSFDAQLCKLEKDFSTFYQNLVDTDLVIVSDLTPNIYGLKKIFNTDCKRVLNNLPFESAWLNNTVNRAKNIKRKSAKKIDQICYCEKHDNLFALKGTGKRGTSNDTVATDEGIFTHSEQLGLGCMYNEERTSFQKFVSKLQKLHTVDFKVKAVKYVILYMYTYKSICARCARSVLIDFYIRRGILDVLNYYFGENIHIRFIVGAKKPYNQTIHRNFEILTSSFQDEIYSGQYPIPFYDNELATNNCIYQWLITEKVTSQQIDEKEYLISSSITNTPVEKAIIDFILGSIPPDVDCMYNSILEGIKISQQEIACKELLTLRMLVSSEIEGKWDSYSDLLVIQIFENIIDGNLVGFQGSLLQEMQSLYAHREQIKGNNEGIEMSDIAINNFIVNQGIVEMYRNMIKDNAAWGGNVELGIVSQILAVKIIVHRRNQDQPDPTINNSENQQAITVHLELNETLYNLITLK